MITCDTHTHTHTHTHTSFSFLKQAWWKKGENRFESLELPEKVQQQWAQAVEFFKVLAVQFSVAVY